MTISQTNPNQLRQPDDDGPGGIIQVPVERQPEAIARLLATGPHPDRDHARRFIDFARDHRISLLGMWSRLDRQGRIVSTVLTVPSPGRTAMVFASRPAGAGSLPSLSELIDHAARQLPQLNVNLAQVLLEPVESLEHRAFAAAGFQDLAILSYLERPLHSPRPQPRPIWPAGIEAITFNESLHDELIDVLDRSYEDTLDCPGLRGHRRTVDILEGHRASGTFDPNLWTIVRERGTAVGALLLNPSADHHAMELVYLGLAKAARGRGLGRRLLQHGLALVDNRSERSMNLAVDEANQPALSLYLAEGFKQALRRRAMIRPL